MMIVIAQAIKVKVSLDISVKMRVTKKEGIFIIVKIYQTDQKIDQFSFALLFYTNSYLIAITVIFVIFCFLKPNYQNEGFKIFSNIMGSTAFKLSKCC